VGTGLEPGRKKKESANIKTIEVEKSNMNIWQRKRWKKGPRKPGVSAQKKHKL